MKPFFNGCEMRKAKKHAVKFFKPCSHTSKDCHFLKMLLNQVSYLLPLGTEDAGSLSRFENGDARH